MSQASRKRLFLGALLLLSATLAFLIYRSNSSAPLPSLKLAPLGGGASNSLGRLASALKRWSGPGLSRVERPEDFLELKGIILSRRRPMAIINTATFEEGDTNPLQLASREYNVHCLSIEVEQVTVRADESGPVTLQMKERPE